MSLAIIGLISVSALLIVPLFGKIQDRILALMKLFFAIEPPLKREILQNITDFKRQFTHEVREIEDKGVIDEEGDSNEDEKKLKVLKVPK